MIIMLNELTDLLDRFVLLFMKTYPLTLTINQLYYMYMAQLLEGTILGKSSGNVCICHFLVSTHS